MVKRQWLRSAVVALAALAFCSTVVGSASPTAPAFASCSRAPTLHIDRVSWLQFESETGSLRIAFQREWLIPGADEKEGAEYVSSVEYDPATTCFEIGNGQVGIHVSSFATQGRGSAAAASGRDVFLLVDVRARKVIDHLDLGITKRRLRSQGCWNANMAHFVIADVNGDGLADIGAVREEIRCSTPTNDDGGTVFIQLPAVWYVTSMGRWQQDSKYNGALPGLYTELPLIGMIFSPVDFVAQLLWQTNDSTRWPHVGRIAFVPAYRRALDQDTPHGFPGAAQSGTWVEMAYCGAKPQKPPLEKLFFRVLFRNPAEELRWIVLPSTLYSAPTQQPADAGVSGMELLANDNGTKVVRFFGSARADPAASTEGAGFQAILLAPKASAAIDVVIEYWGRPERPLAITALVARELKVDGKPITRYFHMPLQRQGSSTAANLHVVSDWSSNDGREVPVTIGIVGKQTILDAFMNPCRVERKVP